MQKTALKLGLIPKEKIDIVGEKSAQIFIVAKKSVAQVWPKIMIMKSKQVIIAITLLFFHYYVHIMSMISTKNLNSIYG